MRQAWLAPDGLWIPHPQGPTCVCSTSRVAFSSGDHSRKGRKNKLGLVLAHLDSWVGLIAVGLKSLSSWAWLQLPALCNKHRRAHWMSFMAAIDTNLFKPNTGPRWPRVSPCGRTPAVDMCSSLYNCVHLGKPLIPWASVSSTAKRSCQPFIVGLLVSNWEWEMFPEQWFSNFALHLSHLEGFTNPKAQDTFWNN